MTAVSMWDVYAAQDREKAHNEYINDPNFPAVEAKAKERGYRVATIDEIHASANHAQWAPELFCWAGGLWIPDVPS